MLMHIFENLKLWRLTNSKILFRPVKNWRDKLRWTPQKRNPTYAGGLQDFGSGRGEHFKGIGFVGGPGGRTPPPTPANFRKFEKGFSKIAKNYYLSIFFKSLLNHALNFSVFRRKTQGRTFLRKFRNFWESFEKFRAIFQKSR